MQRAYQAFNGKRIYERNEERSDNHKLVMQFSNEVLDRESIRNLRILRVSEMSTKTR